MLRLIEGCRTVGFQRFKPAINAVELDAKLVTMTANPLTQGWLLQIRVAVMIKPRAGMARLLPATHG